jgi:hypothetical protein
MSLDLRIKIRDLIESNDVSGLDHLLLQNENLSELKVHSYFNPFVYAIRSHNFNLIDYFHRKGFQLQKVDTQQKRQKTDCDDDGENKFEQVKLTSTYQYPDSLIEAIKCGNIDSIKQLILLGINLNPSYKHIPLQIAYNLYQKVKHENMSTDCIKVYGYELCLWG